MTRRTPISTCTDTLFPYMTLFRAALLGGAAAVVCSQLCCAGNWGRQLLPFDQCFVAPHFFTPHASITRCNATRNLVLADGLIATSALLIVCSDCDGSPNPDWQSAGVTGG